MKRAVLLLAVVVLLSSTALAQQEGQRQDALTDAVIVASTPEDTLIASGVSEKLGIPVLPVERNNISEPMQETLNLLQPSNIVIMGGPDVIAPEMESELANYTNSTTRLWGENAQETSVKVAEYFWPEGAQQVTIVHRQQQSPRDVALLALIEEVETGKPVLFSGGENLSAEVLGEVDRLGTTQATVYSLTQQPINQEPLRQLGVEQINVQQAPRERLMAQIEEQRTAMLEQDLEGGTLIISTRTMTDQLVLTPYLENTGVFTVTDESQIDQAIRLVQQANPQNIWATGNPELVNDIATLIEDQTGREVTELEGQQQEVLNRIIQRRISDIINIQEERYSQWQQQINDTPELQVQANREIQQARILIGPGAPSQAQQDLEQAEQAYQRGDYFEARKLAIQASSQARIQMPGDMQTPQEQQTG